MYKGEKTITIQGATIDELWDTHSDVANWPEWQKDIAWTKVEGEIKQGSSFTIKPTKGPKVKLEVLTYDRPYQFTDVSHLPLATMHTTTIMKEMADGVEIKLVIEMKGIFTFIWKNVVAKDILKGHMTQNQNMVAYIKSHRS